MDILHCRGNVVELLRRSAWSFRNTGCARHCYNHRSHTPLQQGSGTFRFLCTHLLRPTSSCLNASISIQKAASFRLVCSASAVREQSGRRSRSDRQPAKSGASRTNASPKSRVEPSTLLFYATCHPGLEQVVAQELASPQIGAEDITVGKAGVQFSGADMGVGMRANLWLRCAIRVLLLMAEGTLDGTSSRRGGDELYNFVRDSVDWPSNLPKGQTFSVVAHLGVGNTDMNNSQFAATRVKDAICDAIRDARRYKPDTPGDAGADLPLHVTVHHDEVLLYRNMSGPSLHRRGYRDVMHRASLNEAAAAGILMLAGWPQAAQQEGVVLADPMCGSGTLLIEAALMARNVAPGTFRKSWPFMYWPDTNRQLWSKCLEAADKAEKRWNGVLLGNDIHPGALSLAERDIKRALGAKSQIHLSNTDCMDWQPAQQPTVVVTNPPWGVRLFQGPTPRDMDMRGSRRMGDSHNRRGEEPHPDAVAAWDALAACLKNSSAGSTAYVLCGNSQLSKQLRMKTARKYPITIGGVDTRLLKYEIFPQLTPGFEPKKQPGKDIMDG